MVVTVVLAHVATRLCSDTLPAHELEWPFVYVMTDFSEKNVVAWESHPQLQAAFAAGVLDTAVYVMQGGLGQLVLREPC